MAVKEKECSDDAVLHSGTWKRLTQEDGVNEDVVGPSFGEQIAITARHESGDAALIAQGKVSSIKMLSPKPSGPMKIVNGL